MMAADEDAVRQSTDAPIGRQGVGSDDDPPDRSAKPDLTLPQLLAVGAFLIFVLLAWTAADPKDPMATLNSIEYDKLRTLTLFLIGGLLPSDALIRFGRSILFKKVDDPDQAAKYAPATTTAQWLALVTWLAVVAAMLARNDIVTEAEGDQIVEVAQVLILALLPSDAGIRFGRALLLKNGSEAITKGQLKRV